MNPQFGTSASYDPISHTVTFTKDSLVPGQCIYPRITVLYPDPPFSNGTIVENTAYYMFTPVGESRDTLINSDTRILTGQTILGESIKTNSQNSLNPGEDGSYFIDGDINGTSPLDDFCINDTIPPGIEVTQFNVGGWFYGGLAEGEFRVDVYYTTNLNGPTLAPGSPYSIWHPDDFTTTTDLGLISGEYITSINWCFGNAPIGLSLIHI